MENSVAVAFQLTFNSWQGCPEFMSALLLQWSSTQVTVRVLTFIIYGTCLLGEKLASSSIGNALWCLRTVFTRSAITRPEVNRFGWNLGHSENIAWSWHIFGAIRTEVRASLSFVFCPINNERL